MILLLALISSDLLLLLLHIYAALRRELCQNATYVMLLRSDAPLRTHMGTRRTVVQCYMVRRVSNNRTTAAGAKTDLRATLRTRVSAQTGIPVEFPLVVPVEILQEY
jgi:hypothetical protein